MNEPAVPADEIDRLEALFSLKLLDSPAEERFDRVTRIACALFSTPIALVCLVDSDRQWFKSRQGIQATETARDISFCGHAILSKEPLVITNALDDPRFADNPLVIGAPHIRFYAGIPLLSREGLSVGTFCIIDQRPRTLNEEQIAQLTDLANMAQSELHRTPSEFSGAPTDAMSPHIPVSAYLFHTIAENTPGMLGYWTKELRCLYANQAYLHWFGRTPEQMLGIQIQDLMGEALFKKNEPYIRAVLGGQDQQFERMLVKPSGETGHTLVRYVAHTIDGKVRGFFVLVSDITAIKLAHEKLHESERRLHAMITAIPDAIYTHGRQGDFQNCQAVSRAQVNSCWAAMENSSMDDLLPAVATQLLTLACMRALDEEVMQEVRYALPHQDGGEHHFEARVVPYSAESVISIVRDVTERERDRLSRETYTALLSSRLRLSEAEVREQEQVLVLAADAASLGVWVLDRRCNEIRASQRWRTLFGFSLAERLDADSLLSRVHPDDVGRLGELLCSSLLAPSYCESVYRIVQPDGQLCWISSRWRGELDGTGQAIAIRGVSIDITVRKQAELNLQQKQSEINHLSRVTMLGELSGALAHELNQPLTAILSNAQAAQRFMSRDVIDLDEVREILQDIVDEDKRAGEVIRRLRRLFDKQEAFLQDVSVNDTVTEIGIILRNDLINRRVTLKTLLAADLPMASADRVQLQQVLINLVMNGCDAMADAAVPDRHIVVRTAQLDSQFIQVSVSDRGSGLPDAALERVFEPFYTTKKGGMGLGLSICRSIISANGGRLWGENNHDSGATFHMVLPVSVGAEGSV